MEADRLAEHRAPAAPARNDPVDPFPIRAFVDITDVVENGGQQRFALQRTTTQFDRQRGAAVRHVLGRLVDVQAHAQNDVRTRRSFQQDAGQLLAVEEDVVWPFEIGHRPRGAFDPTGDGQRREQRQQRQDVERGPKDGGEEERRLRRRDPRSPQAPSALALHVGHHRPALAPTPSGGGARELLRAAGGGLVMQFPDDLAGDEPLAHPLEDHRRPWMGGAMTPASAALLAWTMMMPATITAAPKTCNGCSRSPRTRNAINPAKTGSAVDTMPAEEGRIVRSAHTKRPWAASVPIRPTSAMTTQMRQSGGRAVPLTTSNTDHMRLPAPNPYTSNVQVLTRRVSVDARST